MKIRLTILALLCFGCLLQAQNTFVYFHNNSDLNYTVSTTSTAHPDDWDGFNGSIIPLEPQKQMIRFTRDWVGSTSSANIYYITTTLTFPTGETLELQIEMDVEAYDFFSNPLPEINFRHSAGGTAIPVHSWKNDNTIYEENTFTVNGKDYILRYQSYSTVPDGGLYDDVLYSIYDADDTPYLVDPADLTNPDVFNVMSYNVFMRPTTLFPNDDQATRANHIADYVHDMDAIILQEVFDNPTRATLLAELAAEYPYQTSVVDDTSNPLEDGGVVIVSRWPFDNEDQLLWGTTCYEDDCTANKGVKYARINKLGKYYHVFGTHMDAFNKVEDVDTRKQQLVMWKNYIDSKSIPTTEPVLMGGDFNVDKFANKLGEYDTLFGNFAAIEPIFLGYSSSWDPTFNLYNFGEPYDPEFLDYVFDQSEHLPADVRTNDCLIMRSNHIDMWRIFDLSDHYAIWGRFEFPALPVEWGYFNADYRSDSGDAILKWQTITETENDKFIIEYSADGFNFRNIGEVSGAGESALPLDYSFIHSDPDEGRNYYRIRQVDFNGTNDVSEIKVVVVATNNSASVFPNPIKKGQAIFVQGLGQEPVYAELFDLLGRPLYQGELSLENDYIDTGDLISGTYVLRLYRNDASFQSLKVRVE